MKSLFFLVVIFYFSNSLCQNKIIYHLTKDKIDKVGMLQLFDSTYSITIKLKPKCANEFYKLTKNNIGKLLVVKKRKTILISAIIKAAIQGGRMVVETNNEKEAKKYLEILQE